STAPRRRSARQRAFHDEDSWEQLKSDLSRCDADRCRTRHVSDHWWKIRSSSVFRFIDGIDVDIEFRTGEWREFDFVFLAGSRDLADALLKRLAVPPSIGAVIGTHIVSAIDNDRPDPG